MTAFGLSDGRLALGGVRCEPVDSCDGTLAELALVGSDGTVESMTELGSRSGGGPDDSDALRIIGQEGSSLWIASFDNQFVKVDRSGGVEDAIAAQGDPCIVADRLRTLVAVDEPSLADDEAVEVLPAATPDRSVRFAVLTYDGSAFAAEADGTIEASSNSIGQCVENGFETFVSGNEVANMWVGNGWERITRDLVPNEQRSSHAVGSHRDEFIVDREGRLLRRVQGSWRETSLQFFAERRKDGPPNVLFADSSGSVVVACMSLPSDQPENHALDCLVGDVE